MKVIDWIDLIRLTEPFVLFEQAETVDGWQVFLKNKMPAITPLNMGWNKAQRGQSHLLSVDQAHPVNFGEHSGFLYMSDPTSVGNPAYPSAPLPAPAQQAHQITMIWTRNNQTLNQHAFDESVGEPPPKGAVGVERNKWTMASPEGGSGHYYRYHVEPHRDDGFPAVIAIGGLRKYCKDGQLHRTGNYPALKADYVGALWMQDGEPYRTNGPAGILLEDYKEFHRDGVYEGYRCKDVHETWTRHDPVHFLKEVVGKLTPLSNRYFHDPSDEMLWMAS